MLAAIQILFRDLRRAQAFGRLYLIDNPDENASSELLRLALGPASPGYARVSSLRQEIARRRIADFAAGDIAVLDGWVFSRSEARIFALTTLR
jgi:hypothetical protein